MSWAHARLVSYGFLLGTAGVKALTSPEAKTVYTHATAAVMRGVDGAMALYAKAKEECEDIAADAKVLNEEREERLALETIEDAVETEVKVEKKPAAKKPAAKKPAAKKTTAKKADK